MCQGGVGGKGGEELIPTVLGREGWQGARDGWRRQCRRRECRQVRPILSSGQSSTWGTQGCHTGLPSCLKLKLEEHLIHGEVDLACVTEIWMVGGADASVKALCPPGFSVSRQPRLEGWGGGDSIVHRNNIMLSRKPVQQQLGLECLFLMR